MGSRKVSHLARILKVDEFGMLIETGWLGYDIKTSYHKAQKRKYVVF